MNVFLVLYTAGHVFLTAVPMQNGLAYCEELAADLNAESVTDLRYECDWIGPYDPWFTGDTVHW
jgi:hypothetical protein